MVPFGRDNKHVDNKELIDKTEKSEQMIDLKEIRQQVGINRKSKSAFPVNSGHPKGSCAGRAIEICAMQHMKKKKWKRDQVVR